MATEIKQDAGLFKWTFGEATLSSANNSKARWDRGSVSPLDQKGSTGWLANLYGGVQTGDDWARVNIPVNELKLPDFAMAQWSYYMTSDEPMGVNIVVWAHDPTDFDKRAEITQVGGHADLEKDAGWNAHEFTNATGGMFFNGENFTGTGLSEGTHYTWLEFLTDALFKTWTIYRITFEYGWLASTTLDDAWVADIKLNGVMIPLGPRSGKHRKTVLQTQTIVAGVHHADDVVSDDAGAGQGHDWDFAFGGTGYISKAVIISATNAIAPVAELQLYSLPPACEMDDNATANSPISGDVPYFIGAITFPAMSDSGTGHSFSIASPSTQGNLPLSFDSLVIYGVLIDKTGVTWANALVSILLTADMDDN